MFLTIYKRALAVLMRKPLKLWGISLLSTLLMPLISGLCGVAIPGLGIAVTLLMTTSMTMVYLAGYRGKEVHTTQIFSCFKDWQTIKRVTFGMAWMTLWTVLWSLIPIVGPFLAIKRVYEYRLTPYILITEPDVALTEAYKESSKRTKGYKLQMWLSDFVIDIFFGVAVGIVGALAGIPYIGFLFGLVLFVAIILYAAMRPLFSGLVQAAFYEEISNPTIPATPAPAPAPAQPQYQQPQYQQPQYQQYQQPQYQQPQYQQPQYQQPQYQQPQQPQYQQPAAPAAVVCPRCGTQQAPGTKFCARCGQPL